MTTQFRTKLITEHLLDNRYVRLYIPFEYYSDILKREVKIPSQFICDFESVPLIKGSSKRGGVIHDYFCRKDSVPVVTKQEAADLYLEAQKCRDKSIKRGKISTFKRFIIRHLKTSVVRVAPGYYHKLKVLSTLDEIINA